MQHKPLRYKQNVCRTHFLGTKSKGTLLTSVGTIQIELESATLVFNKRGKPEYQEKTTWEQESPIPPVLSSLRQTL